MKESFWIYLLMILGLFIIVVMMLIQDLTSTSEEDYYLAKEALEASMVDALDLGLYRKTGEVRIIESKFVESFIRRFAESVNDSKNYTIEFYEIYEMPPKATIFIKTKSKSVKVGVDSEESYDILTAMSGILETKQTEYYGTTLPSTYDDDDDYTPPTTTPVVSSNYVYWNSDQAGNTTYSKGGHPATAKTSTNGLFPSNKGVYIQTETNNKDSNSHQACLYYSGKTFCMTRNYWQDYSEKLNNVAVKLNNVTGKTVNCKKDDNTGAVTCTFDGGECGFNAQGSSWCIFESEDCLVDAEDKAHCIREAGSTTGDTNLISLGDVSDDYLKSMLRGMTFGSSERLFQCVMTYGCNNSERYRVDYDSEESWTTCNKIRIEQEDYIQNICPNPEEQYRSNPTIYPIRNCDAFVDRLKRTFLGSSDKHMSEDDDKRFNRLALELCSNFY